MEETNIGFCYAFLPHPEGRTLVAFHVEDHSAYCVEGVMRVRPFLPRK
jgi:hypothetical protein